MNLLYIRFLLNDLSDQAATVPVNLHLDLVVAGRTSSLISHHRLFLITHQDVLQYLVEVSTGPGPAGKSGRSRPPSTAATRARTGPGACTRRVPVRPHGGQLGHVQHLD